MSVLLKGVPAKFGNVFRCARHIHTTLSSFLTAEVLDREVLRSEMRVSSIGVLNLQLFEPSSGRRFENLFSWKVNISTAASSLPPGSGMIGRLVCLPLV